MRLIYHGKFATEELCSESFIKYTRKHLLLCRQPAKHQVFTVRHHCQQHQWACQHLNKVY